MLRKWICTGILAFVVPTAAWSEEPPASSGIKKQRVSPKLLREAAALPEYKARVAPPSAPFSSLDSVQKLSVKLKDRGDIEDFELLQRFIQEHQRLSKGGHTAEIGDLFNVRCQLLTIPVDEIAPGSVLLTNAFDSNRVLSREFVEPLGKELDHLVQSKKAKSVFEPVTLSAHGHQNCHFHQGGEIHLPSSDGSPSKISRETGTILDLLLDPMNEFQTKVALKLEVKHPGNARKSAEGDVDALLENHKAFSTSFEVKNGESVIISCPCADQRHRAFLIIKVTPRA
jgi:hypothetical protein